MFWRGGGGGSERSNVTSPFEVSSASGKRGLQAATSQGMGSVFVATVLRQSPQCHPSRKSECVRNRTRIDFGFLSGL